MTTTERTRASVGARPQRRQPRVSHLRNLSGGSSSSEGGGSSDEEEDIADGRPDKATSSPTGSSALGNETKDGFTRENSLALGNSEFDRVIYPLHLRKQQGIENCAYGGEESHFPSSVDRRGTSAIQQHGGEEGETGEDDVTSVPLVVATKKQLGLSFKVWPASLCLLTLLQELYQRQSNVFKGKYCVELGSGPGLTGLALSAMGTAVTLLTDLPHVVPLAAQSVAWTREAQQTSSEAGEELKGGQKKKNQSSSLLADEEELQSKGVRVSAEAVVYEWGGDSSALHEALNGHKATRDLGGSLLSPAATKNCPSSAPTSPLTADLTIDLIIAADVVYYKELFAPLANALSSLCVEGHTLVLLSFIKRWKHSHGFFKLLKKFSFEIIAIERCQSKSESSQGGSFSLNDYTEEEREEFEKCTIYLLRKKTGRGSTKRERQEGGTSVIAPQAVEGSTLPKPKTMQPIEKKLQKRDFKGRNKGNFAEEIISIDSLADILANQASL